MKDNDLIIICVTIISLVIIVSVASFAMSGYNPLNPKGSVLSSNDLQLNMTGYDYKLVTNSSMVVNGVTASCVVYNVSGNDDNFNLTIFIILLSFFKFILKFPFNIFIICYFVV